MRYEAFATAPDDWRRRMDELRFTYGKWDLNVAGKATVPPGALVLSRDELREVKAASEALYDASLRAQNAWTRGGGPELPVGVAELADAATPGPFVTRVDLFPTADGWRASEANDDVPGGYNEALGLPAVCWDLIPDGLDVPGDLGGALLGLVKDAGPVGVSYATGWAEDLEVVQLLARWWQANGVEAILAGPEAFAYNDGTPTMAGRPIQSVFRFFPVEWHPGLASEPQWRAAAAGGLRMANPFSVARTQDKAGFGLLSRFVNDWPDLVPETHELDAEQAERIRHEAGQWVLKPRYGRMGAGITMGHESPPETWAKQVTAALQGLGGAKFVSHRRFHVSTVEVAPGVVRTPCVGAYVVDGVFAGCYSRLADGPLVAYDATNVLTLAEGP